MSFLLHLLTIPTRTGALGAVSVSPGMIQTNSSGSLEVVAAVSNAGPNILRIWVGVQANPETWWQTKRRPPKAAVRTFISG
jgi:hypothetical protein